MVGPAKIVLLLLLLAPAAGCAGTDVDAFIDFMDIFIKEEPEKTESEKWMDDQRKKQKQWEKSLEQKSSAQEQAEARLRRHQEYRDCQSKYLREGLAVMREKCDPLKP